MFGDAKNKYTPVVTILWLAAKSDGVDDNFYVVSFKLPKPSIHYFIFIKLHSAVYDTASYMYHG